MRYTKVDKIPKPRKTKNDLKNFFQSFLDKNIQWAKVLYAPYEYASVKSAYNVLHRAAKREKFPVTVRMYKSEIYLINDKLNSEKGGYLS